MRISARRLTICRTGDFPILPVAPLSHYGSKASPAVSGRLGDGFDGWRVRHGGIKRDIA